MLELRVGWTYVQELLASDLLEDPEGHLSETAFLASATAIAVIDTLRLESGQTVEPDPREIDLEPWLRLPWISDSSSSWATNLRSSLRS